MVTKGNVFDPNCPTRVILDRALPKGEFDFIVLVDAPVDLSQRDADWKLTDWPR